MRQHGYRIEKTAIREKLKARREPYWASLGAGRAIGYRKSAAGSGTWTARWTEPTREEGNARPKYLQDALGSEREVSYKEAIEAAHKYVDRCERDWRNRHNGVATNEVRTVSDACHAYIANVRAEKGDEPADRIHDRLAPLIFEQPIGGIRLEALKALDVERWRNGLVTARRKKNSVNRIFRQFAAAMNYTKKRGLIDDGEPWKSVGQFPVADGRRNAYCTVEQRQALLAACDRPKDAREFLADRDKKELAFCTPDLGQLLRGLMFTGARPGELVKAKVRDFNPRTGVLTLVSAKNKKGEARPRDFYLDEPASLEFFKKMAQGKPPEAYLITKADGSAWVSETGKPLHHQWERGMRAAVREANQRLRPEQQMPLDTVAYTVRHTVITDMLSEDGIESVAVEKVLGTSAAMIKQNYFQVVRERLKAKLEKRRSF